MMIKSDKRVLVIDDEPLLRKCLRDMLELDGFEVHEAGNGAEGLEKFQQTTFEIVITDIIMPVKEGIETIREIIARKPDAKIIAITGGGRVPTGGFLDIATTVGAKRVLSKPLSIRDARKAVNELVGS